jgi:hypothetical protein
VTVDHSNGNQPPPRVQSMVDVRSGERGGGHYGHGHARQEKSHSSHGPAAEVALPYPTPAAEHGRARAAPSQAQSCGGGASSIGDMLGYASPKKANSQNGGNPHSHSRAAENRGGGPQGGGGGGGGSGQYEHGGVPPGGEHVRKLRIVNGKIIKGSYKNAAPADIATTSGQGGGQGGGGAYASPDTTRASCPARVRPQERDEGTALDVPGMHRKMVQQQTQV